MTLYITGYGFVNSDGFGGSRKRMTWQEADAQDPFKIAWRKVSEVPFERFGRLDPLSKCVCIAVEMLALESAGTGSAHDDMAVVLGTNYGCLDADLAFIRSLEQIGGGSPQLFSYTLPSMAIAEVAIRHAITGANLCMLAGQESPLAALREAMGMIAEGEASSCLCVGADAVSPAAASLTPAARKPCARPDDPGVFNAFALLLETRASAAAHQRTRAASVQLRHEQAGPEGSWRFDDLRQFLAPDNARPDEKICLTPPGIPAKAETIVIWREALNNPRPSAEMQRVEGKLNG